MIYINHSFHNGFFHRVFDGSTAPRMRAQYSDLSHEYDHWILRELPGDTTLFSAVPRDTWGSQRKRPRLPQNQPEEPRNLPEEPRNQPDCRETNRKSSETNRKNRETNWKSRKTNRKCHETNRKS